MCASVESIKSRFLEPLKISQQMYLLQNYSLLSEKHAKLMFNRFLLNKINEQNHMRKKILFYVCTQ